MRKTKSPPASPYVTVAEAAEIIGVSHDRVLDFVHADPPRLRSTRFGRAIALDRAECEQFAEIPRKAGRRWPERPQN